MDAIEIMKRAGRVIEAQRELLDVYESQVQDLTMMSKIELGDDVIAEIVKLKNIINESNT